MSISRHVEKEGNVLARYRHSRMNLPQALCIETSIMIGTGHTPCGAHIVLLPLGGAMEAIVGALQLRG